MQLVGSAPRATAMPCPHARHRIARGGQHPAVVAVGPGEPQAGRRAVRVNDEVALRARLAPIRRVGPRRRAPLLAGRLALARAARDQSSASASCSRSSITWCSAAQTPAACHAPSRLQLVLPLQPITARGRCFHCMPVRRTSMMPANAARSQRAADHPSASRARAAEAAQPPPTDRRARERRCCLNPRRPVLSRALTPEGSIKRCAWADHSSSSISGCVRQNHSRGSGPCSRFHSPARLQSPRIRAERSTSK